MKKFIASLLSVILIVSFCACSNRSKYSSKAVSAVESIIMYAEKYINGDIDAETANNYIDAVYDEFNEYFETENEDSDGYVNDLMISSDMLNVSTMFTTEAYEGGQISKIQDKINELKQEIGYRE